MDAGGAKVRIDAAIFLCSLCRSIHNLGAGGERAHGMKDLCELELESFIHMVLSLSPCGEPPAPPHLRHSLFLPLQPQSLSHSRNQEKVKLRL